MKIKNVIKKTLCATTALFCLATSGSSVFASYSSTPNGRFSTVESKKSYIYDYYKDDASWYVMMYDYDACSPVYHVKNAGTTSLTYTNSFSYMKQSAYSFSSGMGLGASSEAVSQTCSFTGGMTYTKSFTCTASSQVGRTLPSSAKTGYYKFTLCHNFDKYKLKKHNDKDKYLSTTYCGIPKGDAYIALLYSDDCSDWGKYYG